MTKWAVLIGADAPSEAPSEESTTPGCQNDVETTSQLLREKYDFQRQHMLEMLVNPTSDTDGNILGLTNDDKIPTYENILKALTIFQKSSQPGDLVYVHFSGMVANVPSILPEYSAFPNHYQDMALFPVDAYCTDGSLQPEARFLRDIELSVIFNQLVEKGVEVTAVLDCWATNAFISLPQTAPTIPSSFPLEDLAGTSVVDGKRPFYGGSRMPDSWILDPDPAVAFTMFRSFDMGALCTLQNTHMRSKFGGQALQQHEDENGEQHGFLTFWLNKVLRNHNGSLSFKDLYRLILLEGIHVSYINRTAMSGNGTRMFPGAFQNQRPTAHLSGSQRPPRADCKCQYRPEVPLCEPRQLPAALTNMGTSSPVPNAAHLAKTHAQAFVQFLKIETPRDGLGESLDIEIIGGYRHQKTTLGPYPDFDKHGVFHALSGDHLVIFIRSRSPQDLFLRIVHFSCTYGIQTIYPDAEEAAGFPSFRKARMLPRPGYSANKELALHFRVGLPRSACVGKSGNTHLREAFKIFISEQPVSLKSLELAPLSDKQLNLIGNLDEILVDQAERPSQNLVGRTTHQHMDVLGIKVNANNGTISFDDENKTEIPARAWFCQNLCYRIHKTPDSLAKSLGLDNCF